MSRSDIHWTEIAVIIEGSAYELSVEKRAFYAKLAARIISKHGLVEALDGCLKERFIVPVGCVEVSFTMNHRFGINVCFWSVPNRFGRLNENGHTVLALMKCRNGVFLTTYPTITRFGAPGNTGHKAAEEQFFRNRNHYMLCYGNILRLLYLFGTRMSGVQVPSLRPYFLKTFPKCL